MRRLALNEGETKLTKAEIEIEVQQVRRPHA